MSAIPTHHTFDAATISRALAEAQAIVGLRTQTGGQHAMALLESIMKELREKVLHDETISLQDRERYRHEYVAHRAYAKTLEEQLQAALNLLYLAGALPESLRPYFIAPQAVAPPEAVTEHHNPFVIPADHNSQAS